MARPYIGGDAETRRRLVPVGLQVFPSPAPSTPAAAAPKQEVGPQPAPAFPLAPHTPPLVPQHAPAMKKQRQQQQQRQRRGSLGPWAEMLGDPLLAERQRLYARQHAQGMAAVDVMPEVASVEEAQEQEAAEGGGGVVVPDDAFVGVLPLPHAPTWDEAVL